MKKFEVGKTYTMRSVCDSQCTWDCVVLKRTEKFVTILVDEEVANRVSIRVDNSGEYCLPIGSYSMAPVLRAN